MYFNMPNHTVLPYCHMASAGRVVHADIFGMFLLLCDWNSIIVHELNTPEATNTRLCFWSSTSDICNLWWRRLLMFFLYFVFLFCSVCGSREATGLVLGFPTVVICWFPCVAHLHQTQFHMCHQNATSSNDLFMLPSELAQASSGHQDLFWGWLNRVPSCDRKCSSL